MKPTRFPFEASPDDIAADPTPFIDSVFSCLESDFLVMPKGEGFDQAPDFIVPSEFNPQVVIEAKITRDDGTARDKVTRIQHLDELSRQHREQKSTGGFEVIACIGGRGFGVRREDMRKILDATGGKVFTPKTLEHLVRCTRLREFEGK